GHAPEPLARDTPVWAFLGYFVHAVFAPGWKPFYLVNLLERFVSQRLLSAMRGLVHLDEPVFRGAEDHRIVAAPAVRVAVLVLVVTQQRAAIAEQFHDDRIRGENILAPVFRQPLKIDALVVDRRINLQSIFLPGIKIVGAMSRSRVNDAAALIERDIIGENARHLNGQEGVLKYHPLEIASLKRGAHASFLDAALGFESGDAVGGQQQRALFGFDDGIFEIRMKRER